MSEFKEGKIEVYKVQLIQPYKEQGMRKFPKSIRIGGKMFVLSSTGYTTPSTISPTYATADYVRQRR